MAFVPRQLKDNGIEKVEQADLIISDTDNFQEDKKLIPDAKTWRDQAIKVLNILESQGIDIYDENRTPGMYLQKENKNSPSKNILKILSEKSKESNQQVQPDNKQSKIFNFLTNKNHE